MNMPKLPLTRISVNIVRDKEAIQFGVITGPFASNRHSLRDIIPLLKVTPRLSETGRRKNGRSAIVTDDVSLSP